MLPQKCYLLNGDEGCIPVTYTTGGPTKCPPTRQVKETAQKAEQNGKDPVVTGMATPKTQVP